MSPSGSTALTDWLDRQYAVAARNLTLGVSATHLVKERRPFRQRIVPKPGSVVASSVMGAYDPDPDYFFHWFRDSALVMDALRILVADGTRPAADAGHIRDFIRFSLGLRGLTGAAVLAKGDPRQGVDPDVVQHVRSEADLRGVAGDRVWGEVRVNPDGTLDTLNWSRPQHDGSALRALTLLRCLDDGLLEPGVRDEAAGLLRIDLDFVLAHHAEPSFEIWEDSLGHDYYTRVVQCAALRRGADWLEACGDSGTAGRCWEASAALAEALDGHWRAGAYASLLPAASGAMGRDLDIAVILGVLHAGLPAGPHSMLDPKAQATLAALEDLFVGLFPINAGRPAPALGRFREDRYYGGGAWYIATLAAAEFNYRLAAGVAGGAAFALTEDNRGFVVRVLGAEPGPEDLDSRRLVGALLARGDAFLATVRTFTPLDGALSEQIDRATGAQSSAKHLGWSYAGFITAVQARRRIAQI
ncbi:glycoside hydrolase family 15 protein [Inquilinus sp. Marseille-Q2685]|uniref:glycoside hydrolase family 15 protein n=1 Tax=Inquilinus sp. Marseille-Q2685 TaxID=2866581 RepID=UPI001CE485D0|nr:glycoside hydrolase family 15 protein [Inquilinus sp. Marseille-Q2685]